MLPRHLSNLAQSRGTQPGVERREALIHDRVELADEPIAVRAEATDPLHLCRRGPAGIVPDLNREPVHLASEVEASGLSGIAAQIRRHLVELSADLPVLIEVVDDEAHVDRLLPILDEMVTGGALVTMEKVRVLKYAAGNRRA